MADIPEVTADDFAPKEPANSGAIDTSVPEASPDDFAPPPATKPTLNLSPEAQPEVTNVLQEDARRVRAGTQKYLNQFLEFGNEVSKAQAFDESPSQSFAIQNASPLAAGFNVAGWALDKFQKHVGRHIAAGALKLGMETEFQPGSNVKSSLMTDDDFAHASPALASFRERWQKDIEKGGSALHDIRPTKESQATPKEYMLRELLSTLGGDSFRLNSEEALPALNAMSQDEINVPGYGRVPVSAVLASLTHEVGGLPLMVIGTGAGSRFVAAERTALREGALMAPKELLKKTAQLELKSSVIEGGVQGGIGAAKNNENIGAGILGGAITGGVLHGATRGVSELYNFVGKALGGKKFNIIGPKAEVLSEVNQGRDALLLPHMTWDEYVKQADVVSERSQPKVRKLQEGTNVQQPERGPSSPEYVTRNKLERSGSEDAQHTFTTVTMDDKGDLWLKNVLVNAKSGQSKVTSLRPVTDKDIELYRKQKRSPEKTDREAWYRFTGLTNPESQEFLLRKEKEGIFEGTAQYGTPEDAARFFGSNLGRTPRPAATPQPPGRVETPTRVDRFTPPEKPVVVHADEQGNVYGTPIDDGAFDTTAITPPKIEKGDMAQLPDGSPALVVGSDSLTAVIRRPNGHEVAVEKSNLVKANEPDLSDDAFKVVADIRKTRGVSNKAPPALLSFPKLTVPRVMKLTGEDVVEAANTLRAMEKAGQVTYEGNGSFKVNEFKSEFKPVEDKGFLMYYGTTPDGKGKIGVLRGRDPKNPNNYLLEVGDDSSLAPVVNLDTGARQGPHTAEQYAKASALNLKAEDVYPRIKTLSIPAEDVRSLKPVLWGSAQKSNLVAQHGIQTPLPPETVVTNQNVANQVADATRKNGQLNKLLSNRKGVAQALMNFISNEAFRVPTDVRQFSQKLAASPGVMKANAQAYQETLSAQLGGELSATDTALSQIIKQNATRAGGKLSDRDKELMKFFNSNPQLSQEVQATVQQSLDRLKVAEQKLAAYGVPSIQHLEQLRAAGVEEEYLMNVYLKYMLARKDWAKFVQKQLPDVWKDAVKRVSAIAPDEWSGQVEDRMLDIMGMDVQAETQKMRTTPNGDVKKNLKARIEMYDEIAKVIGKLDSASVQLAHSLAAAESLVQRVETWNTIASTPYWSPGPRPDLGASGGAYVPDLPIYGKAAGGRVHESMKFLLEQKAPAKEGANMFRALSSYWKFNVVPAGGFAPWVNNVMRNWKGMVLSGGLQGTDDLGTFFEAAQLLLERRRNSIMNVSALDEAITNGAVSTGFAGNEINKHKMASRVLNAVKKQQGKGRDLSDIIGAIPEALKGTAQDVGALYDTIDRLFKLTAYLNIKRRGMAKGMSPDDAAALATMRINQSFPNYELVSPTVERMRGGSISGIAPFLSSKAEDMRINALLAARLPREPDLFARIAGAGLTFAAMTKLMQEIRRANGITDADVEKALDADKLSSQAFRPMAAIGPEYDEQGRLTKWDFTPWEDMFLSLQHHETDPLAGAIARNTLQGYFGGPGTLPGGAIDQMASSLFNVQPLSANNPPTWRPGENGVLNFLSYMASHGAVPQMPMRMYEINARGSPTPNPWTNATHEQWSPDEILWKQLGLPFAGPTGKKTAAGRGLEAVKSVDELVKQMKQAPLSTTDKEHVKFLLQQKKQAAQDVVEEYNESKGK